MAMFQVQIRRGRNNWYPIGPLCYTFAEAQGYGEFFVKLRISQGQKKPEFRIKSVVAIQEVRHIPSLRVR